MRDKLPDIKDYLKGCAQTNLIHRFDISTISHFFGRWIPFAFAVGIVTGSIASLMDIVIVNLNNFLSSNLPFLFLYPLVVSVLVGYALTVDSSIGGPGIGYSILHLKTKIYIPVRSVILKLITSTLVLSGGFIAGREGPSFYIGVAIGEWLGKAYGLGKKYKPLLGLIGGGAFTGALLKAPLGSAIFAMELEEMYNLDYRPFVPMIIASIVSYLTFSFFRGESAFIYLTKNPEWSLQIIPYIVVMGLVISLLIYLYTFVFHTASCTSKYFSSKDRPLIGTSLALPFLLILYLTTHDVDFLSTPAHMGIISKLAQIPFPILVDIVVILCVIIVTSFTLSFGIPGGIILPNLLIGAAVGNMFGHIFPDQIVVFTLAGMGAALAAGAKTPLAAIVMITEMTHADVVIPMTAAIITSYTTSFGFCLYLGQEMKLKPMAGEKSGNSKE
ncbi:Cl- channel voltage-gated family protein [Desulfurobacterium thermolithotrophum DSM 11699]|uniref:Cl-channel voltage-gated family protein n=1 Tax=Desulfurobacterium thermolithotrophum (strain DSM 11699 / BSA) TaxID=868864 RepID=F0S2I8_DESTD|nr:chloride channel protein [Desulfurobacterium thermolithotrophum]ADY73060.1 Cl- channel voltage-gated family protein [Desulfurobacterium thermolithotrophum DSM 11699]